MSGGLRGVTTFGELADAARRGSLIPSMSASVTLGPRPPATPGLASTAINPAVGRIIGQLMVSDVKERFSTGTAPDGSAWRPLKNARVNGGSVPLRDTGVLMASFHSTVEPDGVVVSTTHPAAATHNFGATITPKRAKHLAIPLTKEAKRAGSPRKFARKLAVRPTRKAGTLLMFERDRKGRQVGQFLLVDSVTIPARPFMGISDRAMSQIEQVLFEAAARGWLGGPGGAS